MLAKSAVSLGNSLTELFLIDLDEFIRTLLHFSLKRIVSQLLQTLLIPLRDYL